MKTLKVGTKIAVLAGILLGGLSVQAQLPGGPPAGMSAALTKLFGDVKAFTAKAEVQVLDDAQKEKVSLPMDFALLDNKVRVEMDLTQMKNKDMPPGAADSLKQMGMAQIVSVIRPDKKAIYVIYPDQKTVLNMPMSPEDAAAAEKTPKLEKTSVGKETVDGHECVKNKVVITDDKGKNFEATTWNATDLKDFPVQIQTQESQNTSIVRFRKVQFTQPEAKEFELPTGYAQFSDPQEMMQGIMKKMMEQGQKK
jgi:hypothetical protein